MTRSYEYNYRYSILNHLLETELIINLFLYQLHRSAQAYAEILAQRDEGSDPPHSHREGRGENLYYSNRRVNRIGQVAVNRWWSELEFCTTNEDAMSLNIKMDAKKTIGKWFIKRFD